MRRWWGVPCTTALTTALVGATVAHADPTPADPATRADAPSELGDGALPGGLHVPSAEELAPGQVAASALTGFGYRRQLLGPDHRMFRVIGDLAVSYTPIEHLSFALALDGRYDRHYGLPPSGDDGYVGDPRLLARYAAAVGGVRLGAQLGIWIPGKSAPSVAASAISVDAQALATVTAGPGALSVAAGGRLDNSAQSVDNPGALSLQDRVSLGVSQWNEVLGGVHYSLPLGAATVGLELSGVVFLGDGAPGMIRRLTVSGAYRIAPAWSLVATVTAAHVPGILLTQVANNDIPLIPYEPGLLGSVGLVGRFGGPAAPHGSHTSTVVTNDHPQVIEVIEYASVTGRVVDEAGAPVVGATVTVTLKAHTGTGTTDDKGQFTVAQLPIGKTVAGATTLDDTGAEVVIAVDGKKPAQATLTLAKGVNSLPPVTLDPVLPPGQLRGIVKSLASGKPIGNATITIAPGGKTLQSDGSGMFQIDLAPGQYKITVTAPGLANQELDVTIDPNGVSLKNIDMHK